MGEQNHEQMEKSKNSTGMSRRSFVAAASAATATLGTLGYAGAGQFDIPVRLPKPRTKGITMMIDYGLPDGFQEDLLKSHGSIVDHAKFAATLAGAIPPQSLATKVKLYTDNDILTYPGGLLAEVAVNNDRFEAYLDQCEAVGFTGVEVSNIRANSGFGSKYDALAAASKRGTLKIIGEVGLHERKMTTEEIITDVVRCFDSGASLVILEDKEIFGGEQRGEVLPELTKVVDSKKLMIELPKEILPGNTKAYRVEVMTKLLRTFGPNVNVGNVDWDELYLVEMARLQAISAMTRR